MQADGEESSLYTCWGYMIILVSLFNDWCFSSENDYPNHPHIFIIMTRESKTDKAQRLLRSGRIDPLWATVTTLQERVKYLERVMRRGEKTKAKLQEEISALEEEVRELTSRSTDSARCKELVEENLKLRRKVKSLRHQLGIYRESALERTYSSIELL